MAATVDNFIYKGGCTTYDGSPTSSFKHKLNAIGVSFSSLQGFKNASIDDLNGLTTKEGQYMFTPLSPKEVEAIKKLQSDIDSNKTLQENFIVILTKGFIKKQLSLIDKITIDDFNANPILCHALKLNNSEDFIKYNAYQAISRSIVTSMGFLVQDLLLYSSEYVYDGKAYEEGLRTKFDIVIDKLGEVKSFLEIKSGFNDMDVAQIKHYDAEIKRVEAEHNHGYIGITYGKKDAKTVTAGLLENYVENWRDKTLVGKELWDFVSGVPSYHKLLIRTIDETANVILNHESIVKKIEEKISTLKRSFDSEYSSMEEYYDNLW